MSSLESMAKQMGGLNGTRKSWDTDQEGSV